MNEPAVESAAEEGAALRPPTPLGTRDLSSPAPAERVISLPGRDDGAEPEETKDAEFTPPEPDTRRRSRKRALRADAPAYHHSVRTLAITIVICNLLMMTAVIGLAFNFSSTMERSSARTHEQFIQLSKDTKAREENSQKAHSDAWAAALRQAQEAKAEQAQPSKAEFEEMVKRAVRSEIAEARLAALPVNLSANERKAIRIVLGPLVARTTGKAQRNLSSFEKNLVKNAKRKDLVDEIKRVRSIPSISQDEQAQANLDRVEDVLMGD